MSVRINSWSTVIHQNCITWFLPSDFLEIFFLICKCVVKLNILEADRRPRATEYVDQMIDMIKILETRGFVYECSDGLYFDVSKFADYGKLSGNTLDKIKSGARVEINKEKKNPADFAVWKKLVGVNENHIMNWESPWGKGFPGWHIECSAMSKDLLGETIDIHTGGEDNIFPHHECEIAQSESCTGKKFSHFWMHKRHMQVEGEKMSKSTGNFYTLKDLEDKGINPLDFRLLILMSHYRTRTNFTFNGINAAKKFREKFNSLYLRLKGFNNFALESDSSIEDFEIEIDNCLCDDLNTPEMIKVLNLMMGELEGNLNKCEITEELKIAYIDFFEEVDVVLGILTEDEELPEEIKKLVSERKLARENKDWAKSDEIRDELKAKAYRVEDSSTGQLVVKI